MTLSETEILQILKMVEESSFGELRLETGDLKLVVRKKGYTGYGMESEAATSPPPGAKMPDREARPESPPPRPADTPKKAAAEQEGVLTIKSPMLGTVYRRPSPDAPPYVEIGSFVKEDDTVCLIEVMKVFTAVKAGVRGYISEILIETNDMVEYGQPLFNVRPAAEAPEKN